MLGPAAGAADLRLDTEPAQPGVERRGGRVGGDLVVQPGHQGGDVGALVRGDRERQVGLRGAAADQIRGAADAGQGANLRLDGLGEHVDRGRAASTPTSAELRAGADALCRIQAGSTVLLEGRGVRSDVRTAREVRRALADVLEGAGGLQPGALTVSVLSIGHGSGVRTSPDAPGATSESSSAGALVLRNARTSGDRRPR